MICRQQQRCGKTGCTNQRNERKILSKKTLPGKIKTTGRHSEKHDELAKELQEIKDKYEENLKNQDEFKKPDEEILKKQEKLQEMMNDMLSDEMKDLMKQIEDILKRWNKKHF